MIQITYTIDKVKYILQVHCYSSFSEKLSLSDINYLSDVVIRYLSGGNHELSDDGHLFVVVDNGKKTKKTGYFVKEPTGRSWWLGENIQV
jgi:hypothetical protein